MYNLRDKESQLLGKMLTLTGSATGAGGMMASSAAGAVDFNDQWKVLIYDQHCRDIISPMLNIGALRQKGVTLHMLITANREAVPDAPAVYFVQPTEQNIKLIAEDCAKQLYRTVYLNFSTRIDRPLLEKLAQLLTASNSVSMVSKILDQYLDVIALEPGLFSLNMQDAFMSYNEPALSELQIREFMSSVATGLLSTVRVLGALPVIRAPPGGAAQMLAAELNGLLKENVCNSRGPAQALFEDCLVNDRSRPLLLIVDRGSDLFPVLQHASTYQALINDLLDLKLNRVTIDVTEKDATGAAKPAKKKTYDLNTQNDPFLKDYAGAPFPEAVDANEKELAEVSRRESAIRSRPDVSKSDIASATTAASLMINNNSNNNSNSSSSGNDLSLAIESLPEILKQKMNLEAHTNVLQAVMRQIAQREVPTYFELEQRILSGGCCRVASADKAAAVALLKDGSKGNIEDKTRLLMLLAVTGDAAVTSRQSCEELDAAFVAGCQALTSHSTTAAAAVASSTSTSSSSTAAATTAAGAPNSEQIQHFLSAVHFVRRLQSLQSSSSLLTSFSTSSNLSTAMQNSTSNALLSSFLSSATSSASSLMAKATSFFTKFAPYAVTRIVDNLAEGKVCVEDDSYCYFDPRSRDGNSNNRSSSGGSGGPGSGQKYADVIVFVLGGGSYSEFYNLQELLRDKATSGRTVRSILYGCTDVVSAAGFISQMQRLAKPAATATTVAAVAAK